MKTSLCLLVIDELKKLYSFRAKMSAHIEATWGTEFCHEYLKTLLVKDRDFRNGFQIEEYVTILKLYLLHEKCFGDYKSPLVVSNTNLSTD